MGGNHKQPKFAHPPADRGRVPRVAADPDAFYDQKPVWRMSRLDVGCEQWGWNLADGGALHRIREKLASFETMMFRDIFKAGCHDVELHRCIKPAQKRVEELELGIESLVSLRIQGKERVWGIRSLNVVDILWWDPHHQVCPSFLKNT